MQTSESPLEAETPAREASRKHVTDTPVLDPTDGVPTVGETAFAPWWTPRPTAS